MPTHSAIRRQWSIPPTAENIARYSTDYPRMFEDIPITEQLRIVSTRIERNLRRPDLVTQADLLANTVGLIEKGSELAEKATESVVKLTWKERFITEKIESAKALAAKFVPKLQGIGIKEVSIDFGIAFGLHFTFQLTFDLEKLAEILKQPGKYMQSVPLWNTSEF